MVQALPPELWLNIIHFAASSLSDLAVLSALTSSTRALCWTPLTARHQILTNNLVDGERAIDIFAGDPKLLKNPRAFPDLPEFLSLLFSEEVPPKTGRRRSDWEDDEDDGDGDEGDYVHVEGLLDRICGVDGDENEDWVRACIQAWPIDIERLTAPNPGSRFSSDSYREQHFAQAVVSLLCRGRVELLPLMIGNASGQEAMEAVKRGVGVVQIIRKSRDPMPVLTELLDRRKGTLADRQCAEAVGAAAAKAFVDVIKYLGGLNSRSYHEPATWRKVWTGFNDTSPIAINVDSAEALADLGVRINANEFLTVLTCQLEVLPHSIDDEAFIAFLADNMYNPGAEIKEENLWRLIDRPQLRQQLSDRLILPQEPAAVSACLATVSFAEHSIGQDEAVELARRAVRQGARGTREAIVEAIYSGNVHLARIVLDATDPDDLAEWRDLDVWIRMVSARRVMTAEMWRLVLGAGFTVTKRALLVRPRVL